MSTPRRPALWLCLTIEAKPEQAAQTVQRLAEWCYQFTPAVMAYKDCSVLLEIGGSLRLFKGLSRLLEQIDRGLRSQGLRYSSGLAHTREAAWLFSRYRAEHDTPLTGAIGDFSVPDAPFWLPLLHSLPLRYLDVDSKRQQQLFNLGLRTLGELLALPRRDLGRRFGRELLELLLAITGEGPAVTADFQPGQRFSARLDFATGLSRLDELIKPMEQLLIGLLGFLNQRHLYSEQLEWRLCYANRACDTVTLHASPANHTLESLLSLSRLKLEHMRWKAPLESLLLGSDTFSPAAGGSGELFPELSHPNNQWRDYCQLLDKLIARLGPGHLSTLGVGDDHVPEYRQITRDPARQPIDQRRVKPGRAAGKQRSPLPLWFNGKALPIDAPADNPSADNPSARQPASFRLVSGPQRIDSHWWRQRCRRDYFIARHRNGAYCWIFQDPASERWFLHGFYG